MSDEGGVPVKAIAGPNSCVRTVPIPGPHEPPLPFPDAPAYVFPTWRAALADAQARIGDAYEKRRQMFRAASDAGLSYREIGEATDLSPAAVGKIIGRGKTTLDSPVTGVP
jgi:DNA-directed RNA polymerase specialized sigma24 family protein